MSNSVDERVSITADDVSAVVVTYGDRAHLCVQVIERCLLIYMRAREVITKEGFDWLIIEEKKCYCSLCSFGYP